MENTFALQFLRKAFVPCRTAFYWRAMVQREQKYLNGVNTLVVELVDRIFENKTGLGDVALYSIQLTICHVTVLRPT